MFFNLSMTIWNEAESIVKEQGVRKVSKKISEPQEELLSAHVKSAFGFIHHPRIRYNPVRKQVSAFDCDCWNSTDGNVFCAHCAALLANEYEERDISVNATVEGNKRLRYSMLQAHSASSVQDSSERITITDDLLNSDGNRLVSGKSISGFGFVHHPQITLSGTKITDFTCDCYSLSESRRLCSHCEALSNLLFPLGSEENPAASMNDPAQSLFEEETYRSEKAHPFPGLSKDREALNEADLKETMTREEMLEFLELSLTDDSREEAETTLNEMVPDDLSVESLYEERTANHNSEILSSVSEFIPKSMEVVFGHDRETGKPVSWYPNDTEQLVHINTGIIGTMGTGKTQFAKSLITQLYRQQRNNFDGSPLGILIFDYKGDYNESKTDFIKAVNGNVLGLYHLPYNPFSLRGLKRKPQLPYHIASTFAGILTRIYRLGSVQFNILLHCIITAYEQMGITTDPATWDRTAPTFDMVYQVYLKNNTKQDALFSAMYALAQFEIFEKDPEKMTSLFDLLNGVVVLDLSGYDSRIQNLTVAITLDLFCSQMQNSGSSQWDAKYRQLTKLILVDEADNIMSEGFPALKTILKEGREFGVGTILSTQSLKHFGSGDEEYAGYILTWIVHSVSDFRRNDADFIFRTSELKTDGLLREITLQKKFESIAVIGNSELERITDLPFWKISDDLEQSYLRPVEEDEGNSVSQEACSPWFCPAPIHSLEDIVGMDDFKDLLWEYVRNVSGAEKPYSSDNCFIFYGESGNEINFVIDAFIHELIQSGFHYLKLSVADMTGFSREELEKRMQEVVDETIDQAPCILFIEEIDDLFRNREESDTAPVGTQSTISFQSYLDQSKKIGEGGKQVVFVASANDLSCIDRMFGGRCELIFIPRSAE